MTLQDGRLFHTKKGKPVDLPEPLAPLADTHTHLTGLHDHNAPMAIARAKAAGVHLMVVPLDPTDDASNAIMFLTKFSIWQTRAEALEKDLMSDHVHFTEFDEPVKYNLPKQVRMICGTHPYGAPIHDANALNQMKVLFTDNRCIGVGEIGLDYNCDVDHDIQKKVFREQLAIARERYLPVELHIRDAKGDEKTQAHADAIEILKQDKYPDEGCILHCFTQGVDVMQPFVDLGCHIAFGGASTFKNSDEIREAVAACPEHLILSETDAPYMAPHPLRGQECEPAMVALVAANIAQVREDAGVNTRQESYDALWNNACRIFNHA